MYVCIYPHSRVLVSIILSSTSTYVEGSLPALSIHVTNTKTKLYQSIYINILFSFYHCAYVCMGRGIHRGCQCLLFSFLVKF